MCSTGEGAEDGGRSNRSRLRTENALMMRRISSVPSPSTELKQHKAFVNTVSNRQDYTKHFKINFTLWQTHSMKHHLNFSGKHLAMLQLMHISSLYKYPPQSKISYSFIQLSKLEQCRVNKFARSFIPQHRIQTWVLLVESPKLYP